MFVGNLGKEGPLPIPQELKDQWALEQRLERIERRLDELREWSDSATDVLRGHQFNVTLEWS